MKRLNPHLLVKRKLNRVPIVEKRLEKLAQSTYRDLFDYMGIAWFAFEDYLSAISMQRKSNLLEFESTVGDLVTFAEKNAKIWAKGNKRLLPLGDGKPNTINGWEWEFIPKEIIVCEFPFGTGALISLLRHRKVPTALLDVVPSPSEWTLAKYGFNAEYFVDGGFVELLVQGKTSTRWRNAVSCFSEKWDSDLYEPSMLAYADIIKHANSQNWSKSVESIHRSIELWKLRADDRDFPEFQSWEGGGPARYELQTDLRLCVILRRCFAKNVKLLAAVDLSAYGRIF